MSHLIKSLPLVLVMTFTILWTGQACADHKIVHYNLNISVDNKMTTVTVKADIQLKQDSTGDLKLILNTDADINSIIASGKNVPYVFDRTAKKAPNPFIDGRLITINADDIAGVHQITFDYNIPVEAVTYWKPRYMPDGFDTKSGLEMGLYSGWIPFGIDSRHFHYDITVSAPQSFKVSGHGKIWEEKGRTHIKSTAPQFDVPIIMGTDLKTEVFSLPSGQVEISHFNLNDKDINSIHQDISLIDYLYTDKFGTNVGGGTFQFFFSPRILWTSYSRAGFVTMITGQKELNRFQGLAHEIGHFWWTGAPSSDWQDWLNESFAEYSALIAMDHKYRNNTLSNKLAQYEKESEGLPPIWGINRQHPRAYSVLYGRGPVILHGLRSRLGDTIFFEFLNILLQTETYLTDDLLNILANTGSQADADWLQDQLKSD